MTFRTLRDGDTVAIIAPAGPIEADRLALVPALYRSFGLQARIYPGCHQRSGYLAGSDEIRLADLHAALADPDIAAIHCVRGGYGCMRLLDRIGRDLVRSAAKLLIGYSDITALHALWAREGLASLHAPMPTSDLLLAEPNPAPSAAATQASRHQDRDALFAVLRHGLVAGTPLHAEPATETAPLRATGRAEGLLIGGNLSLVAALLGTPWAWNMAGAILFLEDINEEPHRLDRLLTQLRLAGVFDSVAGIVLGSFTESACPLELLGEMLLSPCLRRGIPLLGGWPAGHGTPNRPLPLGVRVRLDADAGHIEVLQGFLLAE